MARFASDILTKFQVAVRNLEVQLGPDTGDLSLRVGMHSGPVTAGVLRGERARFQLFGDTVNTCSRVESSGEPGRVHMSNATADLLAKAGRENWFFERQDEVQARGKGLMKTAWLARRLRGRARSVASVEERSEHTETAVSYGEGDVDREMRLIDWNVEKLVELLKEILARREVTAHDHPSTSRPGSIHKITTAGTPLEEVKEIIVLPEFNGKKAHMQRKPEDITVPQEVIHEIREYVHCIANMYRANPFHNFAHASHVVMSICKLMSRIVAPKHLEDELDTDDINQKTAGLLHDHTYGITSDPLTQFACAFSGLIHDADHPGVGNPQLAKENEMLGELYKGRSVAEQNSLDLAWNLFMDSRYKNFRETLCSTTEELKRFRQLIVNSVMATDIMDKELKELRNNRWDKAFKGGMEENTRDAVNRKATIVIEHLIQASDVSHTMQHWHVYRKWNENLFREMYKAFKEGRSTFNPADGWYKGEIGFFDFYIIPLAKKLKDCGVFGVSSDEYLNYAMQNRNEWEIRGQEVVAEMIESVKNDYESQGDGDEASWCVA